MRCSTFTKCLVFAPFAVACGPSFDPPSVVSSLRVLAVRPAPAFGRPGESVTLEMLYVDGAEREFGELPRPIQVAWLAGCYNPESRLYFGCFTELSALAAGLSERVVDTPPDAFPPGLFAVGT